MNNNGLGVAVIGCGRIAHHHCQAISQTAGFDLVAVCDLDPLKSQALGEAYDVAWYDSYHDMLLLESSIDLVAIATPSGMHFEHSEDVLRTYNKNIIVEKPTFLRPDQLYDAYNLGENLRLNIFPVFQNRYNLAVQRVKQAIMDNELGEIRTVSVRVRWCRPQSYYDLAPWRGTFAQDGGALTNQGIHHLDLLRYLCGEVTSVNAVMRTFGADIEVEDTTVGTLNFESGAVGQVEITTAARPNDFEAAISIVGSKGLAQIGGIAVNELQIFTPNPAACEIHSEDFSDCVYGYGHHAMYQDIIDYFRYQKPYPISAQDCLNSLKLLHGFYHSDEVGTWVDINDIECSCRLGAENEFLAQLYRCNKGVS